MTLRWPMTFPPPTRLNNASPPPTAPRTPASTRVVWLTFLQRDANPSDVIDQAIIVPLPDDDRDTDTTLF